MCVSVLSTHPPSRTSVYVLSPRERRAPLPPPHTHTHSFSRLPPLPDMNITWLKSLLSLDRSRTCLPLWYCTQTHARQEQQRASARAHLTAHHNTAFGSLPAQWCSTYVAARVTPCWFEWCSAMTPLPPSASLRSHCVLRWLLPCPHPRIVRMSIVLDGGVEQWGQCCHPGS